MEKTIVYQENNYSIWRYNGIPKDAMAFLDNIAWGNEGAVYEHKNTEAHIRLLHRPTLLAIHEGERIQGTAVFCNTDIRAGAAAYNCYYVRYFAASDEIKGKGVMKHYAVKTMEAIRGNEQTPTVFFACVEKGNKGSYYAVQNAGYNNIGVMKTNGFSRFFPKENAAIERVNTEVDKHAVKSLLEKQYAEHALVQFDSIFVHDNYFVIRDQGDIVAGCQFHRAHWVVNRMPGLSGKIIMATVPYIPLINGLFNPRRFEFLAFEGIYVKPGYEKTLLSLFEGLLAKEKLKSALFWMGETCPVREKILGLGKMGLLHEFVKDSDAYIMASFHDLNAEEIDALKSRPLFASAFDYI